jgi:hypothetical protein
MGACRISYEEIQDGSAKPYLLGELQRPHCTNCAVDKLWSHFCQFKSHGPACPKYDQQTLLDTLMDRCMPLDKLSELGTNINMLPASSLERSIVYLSC